MKKILKYIALTSILLNSCNAQNKIQETAYKIENSNIKPTIKPQKPEIKINLPEINREFRGVWISSVANINWPSRNNLSTDQQKNEALQMLDLLQETNFNAVILQVRPSSDALYKSDLEPWSYFLTGETGKAPNPFYDPLEFWISEAHKRGIELHIWLNPFRAHYASGTAISQNSIVKKMPEQMVKLRNGMYWLDPSDPKTQDHVSKVVADLVKRYDVDAVHFDDYFYPYKEYNGGRDFPDNKSWELYEKSGGSLSKADWRRANVNKFVKRIYEEIKTKKKFVKFGISPFGIWKSGFPADVSGTSQYDELFADPKLWLNEGWCDYLAPQLYWKEDGPQRYSSLLKWWQNENIQNRHLFPGLNTVGIKGVANRSTEIANQINTNRQILKSKGEIHWSIAGITKNPEMLATLQNLYKEKALIPASPWLKSENLEKPFLNFQTKENSVDINWNSVQNDKINHWILYSKYDGIWEYEILNKNIFSKNLVLNKSGKKLNTIAIKSVDRLGNESEYSAKEIQ